MRGRKPKPTMLKVLDGNPGRRPLNEREPAAPQGVPACPDWLSDEAKAEWKRVIPELQMMGLLSTADRAALAAYCTAWARWVEAEAMVRKFGPIVKSPEKGFPMKSPYLSIADQALETMRKLMVEFGLTPSSRSRIKVPDGGDAADEFDQFLEAG
jgi:P27 family predicted phage terminase small subunit